MEKYIGHTIEIIYLGRDGQITQRQIDVCSVSAGTVIARCFLREAPRMFRIENILAVRPAERRIS